MDAQTPGLAEKLLDAQVEFVLAELTGDRLAEVIARDVDDVLGIAATSRIADIVDVEQVKETGRKIVDQIGGSPLIEDMLGPLSDAMYNLVASEDHRLGDVVDRDSVAALIAKILSMQRAAGPCSRTADRESTRRHHRVPLRQQDRRGLPAAEPGSRREGARRLVAAVVRHQRRLESAQFNSRSDPR